MKPVFQALFVIIIVLALGALVLSFTIDGMVKSNIEDSTSEMLGTSVEVNDASISILDGSGTIGGITIHNPEGFSETPALKLQEIFIKMDLSTLLSDTVIIDSVEIKQPEVYVEQAGGNNNIKTLSDKFSEAPSTDLNVIIDYLLVEEGEVTLSSDVGEERSVQGKMDRFELTGIGREGDNTMEQTMRQILEPILKRAAREAVEQGLLDAAKEKLEGIFEN